MVKFRPNNMTTAASTKAAFAVACNTGKAHTASQMVMSTRAHGKTVRSKARVSQGSQMDQSIKATFQKESLMGLAKSPSPTGEPMTATGSRVQFLGKASRFMPMVSATRANSETPSTTAKASCKVRVDMNTKAIGSTGSKMGLARSLTLIVRSMTAILQTANAKGQAN